MDIDTYDTKSAVLYARAKNVLPGGVNSPVRSFQAVGRTPLYISKAQGCRVWDIDGNEYVDFLMAFGAVVLGHGDLGVLEAIRESSHRHLSLGTVHILEIELAERICDAVPSIEQVRFVVSGTEATMTAIRIARGATGRPKIVKFSGNYHGHVDDLMVDAGSGLAAGRTVLSKGIPQRSIDDTIVLPYNDAEALLKLFSERGQEIAAVILEPIAGNMNLVEPVDGFLQACRAETKKHDAVLIFDEVITGFRVAPMTAQQRYGITPDLTILGKVIGGGMPVGAVGGRRDLLELLAPQGSVYQAGTFGAHPVCLAAGLAVLNRLIDSKALLDLETLAKRMSDGINAIASERGLAIASNSVGGLFGIHFSPELPRNLNDVRNAEDDSFRAFFRNLLDRRILIAPSRYEVGFVSCSHSADDIDASLGAMDAALSAC